MEHIKRPSTEWLIILSELFVDLAAGLFIIIFAEPILLPIKEIRLENILLLTSKLALGILFLILAKKLRKDSQE